MSESMRASVRLIILWVCVCVCVYVNTCVNIYICVNLCSSTLFVLIVYKHTDHVLADLHQEFVLRYKEVVSCCERKHSESQETDCFFMIVAKSINVTTESTHRSVNGCSTNERRHLKSCQNTNWRMFLYQNKLGRQTAACTVYMQRHFSWKNQQPSKNGLSKIKEINVWVVMHYLTVEFQKWNSESRMLVNSCHVVTTQDRLITSCELVKRWYTDVEVTNSDWY